MAEYKIVLNDAKSGKAYQREVKEAEAEYFIGKKLGETLKGDNFSLAGYEFLITGGSDKSGFPMRKDLDKDGKARILAVSGTGIKATRKGMKIRKTVAGNTIGNATVQINLKITKYGKENLAGEAEAPAKEEAKKE